MNTENLATLQALYEEADIDNFVNLFVEVYKKSTTKQRLAMAIHFMNEWFDAEYIDIPRMIAEIA